MMRKPAILWIFLFFPLPISAGLVDGVEAALESYDKLTSVDYSQSFFLADQPASFGLPGNWQVYWLDEPVFGTRIFLSETGERSAPLVLLVHGLGQNGLRDWMSILPALEEHYRVLLIDLPGFGNSPPPNKKLSPTRYADLLHFVKPYFSSEPIAVVGHSLGGAVALRYAHRYPDDVNQVALIDVAGILQRTAFIKHSTTDRMPMDPKIMSGALLGYAIGLHGLGNAMIENIMKWPDPTAWLGKSDYAWGAAFGRYPSINAALGLIEENFSSAIYEQEKPVSALWGAEDLVAPPRTGQALVQNLEHGRLEVIPGAGHVPMASHPKEVSAWLLKSLQTVPDRKPLSSAWMPEGHAVYTCSDQVGGVVSGAYFRIDIEDCTGLVLDGVTANEIIVRNSVIEVENTEVLSARVALEIDHSTVVMTAGRVHGLINVSNSRVDFAGVEMVQAKPFNIGEQSRLVISVSRAGEKRYLHADLVLADTQF